MKIRNVIDCIRYFVYRSFESRRVFALLPSFWRTFDPLHRITSQTLETRIWQQSIAAYLHIPASGLWHGRICVAWRWGNCIWQKSRGRSHSGASRVTEKCWSQGYQALEWKIKSDPLGRVVHSELEPGRMQYEPGIRTIKEEIRSQVQGYSLKTKGA